MKFVIQRVNHASVKVEGETIGEIGAGYLILMGVGQSDTEEIADKMIKKTMNLRIFKDEEGKINRSIADIGGEVLVVSQFTLYASCKKGNRPSFFDAGSPQMADSLYQYVVEQIRAMGYRVETGEFGADMKVSLENDGPFTIVLDSEEIL